MNSVGSNPNGLFSLLFGLASGLDTKRNASDASQKTEENTNEFELHLADLSQSSGGLEPEPSSVSVSHLLSIISKVSSQSSAETNGPSSPNGSAWDKATSQGTDHENSLNAMMAAVQAADAKNSAVTGEQVASATIGKAVSSTLENTAGKVSLQSSAETNGPSSPNGSAGDKATSQGTHHEDSLNAMMAAVQAADAKNSAVTGEQAASATIGNAVSSVLENKAGEEKKQDESRSKIDSPVENSSNPISSPDVVAPPGLASSFPVNLSTASSEAASAEGGVNSMARAVADTSLNGQAAGYSAKVFNPIATTGLSVTPIRTQQINLTILDQQTHFAPVLGLSPTQQFVSAATVSTQQVGSEEAKSGLGATAPNEADTQIFPPSLPQVSQLPASSGEVPIVDSNNLAESAARALQASNADYLSNLKAGDGPSASEVQLDAPSLVQSAPIAPRPNRLVPSTTLGEDPEPGAVSAANMAKKLSADLGDMVGSSSNGSFNPPVQSGVAKTISLSQSVPLSSETAKPFVAIHPHPDAKLTQQNNSNIGAEAFGPTAVGGVPFVGKSTRPAASTEGVLNDQPGLEVSAAQKNNIDVTAKSLSQTSVDQALFFSQSAPLASSAAEEILANHTSVEPILKQKNTINGSMKSQSFETSSASSAIMSFGAAPPREVPAINPSHQTNPGALPKEDEEFNDQSKLIGASDKPRVAAADEDGSTVLVTQVKAKLADQSSLPTSIGLSPVQQITQIIVGAGVKASIGAMAPDVAPAQAETQTLSSGVKILNFALDPPNLGGVSVKLRLTNRGLEMHVEAERPETTHLIQNDKDQLVHGLQSSGYSVDTLEIKTADSRSMNLQQDPAGTQSNANNDATQQGGQAKDQNSQQDNSNANRGAASRERQEPAGPARLDTSVQTSSASIGSNDLYI